MIKENQIICCEDNDICSESDSNLEDKQVFETTLLELSLENETKTKYIQKIQHQNKLFLDDVSLAEEEMNNTIKLHELKMKELNAHIEELKKKPTKTTTDKISTTTLECKLKKHTKSVHQQTLRQFWIHQRQTKSTIQDVPKQMTEMLSLIEHKMLTRNLKMFINTRHKMTYQLQGQNLKKIPIKY
ncbi:hypothetical protein JTB14_000407 [Gonioctena quinquepunctata]|nr:hypothetical protein JTB14_000407 [Gonioctena quinquepunctata]